MNHLRFSELLGDLDEAYEATAPEDRCKMIGMKIYAVIADITAFKPGLTRTERTAFSGFLERLWEDAAKRQDSRLEVACLKALVSLGATGNDTLRRYRMRLAPLLAMQEPPDRSTAALRIYVEYLDEANQSAVSAQTLGYVRAALGSTKDLPAEVALQEKARNSIRNIVLRPKTE